MEWFIAVVVVAILGVAAMAAAGGMGEMAKDPVRDTYRQDLPLDRPLNAADIQTLRFGVTLRGYAMSQVDDILDRLTREIADRDATIRELTGEVAPAAGVVEESGHAADPEHRGHDTREYDAPEPHTAEYDTSGRDTAEHGAPEGEAPQRQTPEHEVEHR